MSWGSLSQFSPNLQQPMPTTATRSRMASCFMVARAYDPRRATASRTAPLSARSPRRGCAPSADRSRLPEVVRRAARLVDAPERQLDGHPELHFLGIDVGHLQVQPGPLDVDDAGYQRRLRAAREVVEGEGADGADAVGEADGVELVLGVAGEA